VPYVHFPPYTRAEAISIVSRRQDKWLSAAQRQETASEVDEHLLRKLYPQFAATVYDSLIASTRSTSIQVFQATCDSLWPKFIVPIITPNQTGEPQKPWTFSRLLVLHRTLFQTGESALYRSLAQDQVSLTHEPLAKISSEPPLLKHFPTLILLSAYLASHTQQKHDPLLFSRMSSSASKKRGRRSRQTPTKKTSSTPSATPSKDGVSQSRARGKSMFAANLAVGVARPFSSERLVAILRAVHPHGVAKGRGVSDRVYRELGELEKLRLVSRVGGSHAAGEDASEDKWRVNVSRDWVVHMGEAWGMGVSEYEIDQDM
jgi:origin recognition complex subunit 5